MSTQYWIAQYVQDLFKREPKNVAVFVQANGEAAAKFIGTSEDGSIDGRKLRFFKQPDVYRQWVDYWNEVVAENNFEELAASSNAHYRIVDGGSIGDTGTDSPSEIANSLFNLLVSADYSAAINGEDFQEVDSIKFKTELIDILQSRHLLAGDAAHPLAHPINKDPEIHGKISSHRPSFSQMNGKLHVFEPIDFSVRQKTRSRDHAGFAAYMFHDIRKGSNDSCAYSLIKASDSDKDNADVQYAIRLLKNESDIVEWNNPAEQLAFIESRRKVAVSL